LKKTIAYSGKVRTFASRLLSKNVSVWLLPFYSKLIIKSRGKRIKQMFII